MKKEEKKSFMTTKEAIKQMKLDIYKSYNTNEIESTKFSFYHPSMIKNILRKMFSINDLSSLFFKHNYYYQTTYSNYCKVNINKNDLYFSINNNEVYL